MCEQLARNGNDDVDNFLALLDDEQPIILNTQNDWVDDMIIFLQTRCCVKGLERSKQRYYTPQAIP